ncbi:N-acylglucosamine 2-epimerase [compost metagenome]
MLEKPRGAVDNWFEPGHQFEWFYLLESSPLLRSSDLHASLSRAFAYAEQYGVKDTAVLAMLSADGQVLDATQRIWAQAEYVRALALRPDNADKVLIQLQALQQRFLHAGGWYECRDASGAVSRSDMPSTTPYHLATCLQGLQRQV